MENNESLKKLMADMLPLMMQMMVDDPSAFLKAIIPTSEPSISEHQIKTINEIIDLPLEELACRGDGVTYHNHTNIEWVRKQLGDGIGTDSFPSFNSTSVGNLARIAVGCPDQELKTIALDTVNSYIVWWKEKY